MKQACNSEVIEEVQNLRQQIETINDLAIKNEELEDQNRQLLEEIESFKENEASYQEQNNRDYTDDYEPVSSQFLHARANSVASFGRKDNDSDVRTI